MCALDKIDSDPSLKGYSNFALLSRNDLCLTWSAVEQSTNQKVLLKVANPNGPLRLEEVRRLLASSYRLQRSVHHSGILRPKNLITHDNEVAIIYPWLDHDNWKELAEIDSRQNWPGIFKQIALATDFLHAMGLVHCDLKIENCLWNEERQQLKIIDLEYVNRAGATAKGIIFGTPGYIAPEIKQNETVTHKADLYSLGRSLENLGHNGTGPSNKAAGLSALIEKLSPLLVREHHVDRPDSMLELMTESGVLSAPEYASLSQTLLRQIVLSSWREVKPEYRSDGKRVWKAIVSENRVLGLDGGLKDHYIAAFEQAPAKTSRLFLRHLKKGSVTRLSDHWSIQIDDDSLESILIELERLLSLSDGLVSAYECVKRNEIAEAFKIARQESENGWSTKTLFILRKLASQLNHDDDSWVDILSRLSEVCVELGRVNEAKERAQQLVDSLGTNHPAYLSSLVKLADICIMGGDYDGADRSIARGLELVGSKTVMPDRLLLEKARAWILAAKGDTEGARDLLDRVVSLARSHNFSEAHVSALYGLAILSWREGENAKAQDFLHSTLRLAQKLGLTEMRYKAAVSLSMIYHESADYAESLEWGRKALEIKQGNRPAASELSALRSIRQSAPRLGKFDQAAYWLQRERNILAASHTPRQLVLYLISVAYFQIRSAELEKARVSLERLVQICDTSAFTEGSAYILFNLAEVALFQGEHEKCSNYATKSGECFRQLSRNSTAIEADSLLALSELYYGSGSPQFVREILDRLINEGRRCYAGITLFHLLLQAVDTEIDIELSAYSKFVRSWERTEAPEFKALICLYESLVNANGGNTSKLITDLKQCLRLLRGGRSQFLAGLVSRKIGSLYINTGKLILGAKFLRDATRLFDSIGNRRLSHEIEAEINTVQEKTSHGNDLVQNYEVISDILVNMQDYDSALEKIIQFAVDQVGAERGALLLSKGEPPVLRIESFVGCDDDSLKDIQDISSHIPALVSEGGESILVDDALGDNRTKGYKSIARHNILSVLCVPVASEGETIGALYLDHHIIPALFDRNDLPHIRTMANLVGALVSIARKRKQQETVLSQLGDEIKAVSGDTTFVTQNSKCLELLRPLKELANSNISMLLMGESGTGKDVVSRMIHELSPRSGKPFLRVNCSALAPTMVESELFGIARRAATGVDAREGKFAAADGGTLFMDEIADMPLDMQAILLHAVENKEYQRIGSNLTEYVDVRFIFATNKDISQMVQEGRFRKDLYYRISGVTIAIPPLRNRKDDVAPLIDHFISRFGPRGSRPKFSREAMALLEAYSWPGNVRELRNFIERVCILHKGRTVTVDDLPKEMLLERHLVDTSSAETEVEERERILDGLNRNQWNQSRTARELGISLSSLRRRIKKYRLRP